MEKVQSGCHPSVNENWIQSSSFFSNNFRCFNQQQIDNYFESEQRVDSSLRSDQEKNLSALKTDKPSTPLKVVEIKLSKIDSIIRQIEQKK